MPQQLSFTRDFLWQGLLLVYAVFVISNTMFSSRKDLEGTLGFLLAVSIIGIALFLAGIRPPDAFWQVLGSETVQSLFQRGSIFLAIPLGINVCILFVVRVVFGIR